MVTAKRLKDILRIGTIPFHAYLGKLRQVERLKRPPTEKAKILFNDAEGSK